MNRVLRTSLQNNPNKTDRKQGEKMNRVIMFAIVLLMTGSVAAENPYALGSKIKKIDQDQASLLSELEEIRAQLEAEEDAVDDEDDEDEVEAATQKPVTEQTSIPEVQSVTESAPDTEEMKAEEARRKKAAEDQQRLNVAQKKQAQEKLALEKLAAEALVAEKAAMEKAEAKAKAKVEEEKRIAEELARLEAEKAALEKQFAIEEAAKAEALKKAKEDAGKKKLQQANNDVDSGKPSNVKVKNSSTETGKSDTVDPEVAQKAALAIQEVDSAPVSKKPIKKTILSHTSEVEETVNSELQKAMKEMDTEN